MQSATLFTPINHCIEDNYYFYNGRFYFYRLDNRSWSYTTSKYDSSNLVSGYIYNQDNKTCLPFKNTINNLNIEIYKTDLLVYFSLLIGFIALLWSLKKTIYISKLKG